jgi:ribosomal protein L37AE/L43A
MDYYKLIKENKEVIEKMLEGRTIAYECPFCKKERQIQIITIDNAICTECKNEFPIKIKLHID